MSIRNTIPLTDHQKTQVLKAAREMGMDRADIVFYSGPSAYSDSLDKILIGPNIFPATVASEKKKSTILQRLSMKAALAHEFAHAQTVRNGIAFEAGSLPDEFQASIFAARKIAGLDELDQCRLILDAVERSKERGGNVKKLKSIIHV